MILQKRGRLAIGINYNEIWLEGTSACFKHTAQLYLKHVEWTRVQEDWWVVVYVARSKFL